LKQLEGMPLNELIASTTKIIGKYPNTYTFTKSLCERVMKVRQNGVPLCIVRPAIINTSYAEPFPGWIDSIAAAAALFMFVGLGIVKELKGNLKKIGDTVPVDVVVATIIVASAFNVGNKSLPIYHVGSSDRNPLTWGEIKE
jgi:alcohol-forming fatty acyl-CoA reductase